MSTLAYSQSQSIQGRIYDATSNEGLPFANVILLKDGIQKAGTTTDLDGNYSFTGFDPGVYDVEAVYVGYPNARITGVQVSASQSVPLDVQMSAEQGIDLDVVTVTEYRIPLIKQDETASGNTLGGEDIKKLPTRSVTSLIATTAAVSQDKEGEEVSFRGAREGDQIVYVDGVRVRGRSVPAQDIEQIQVITGGVPAAYGDVTGGVTNIITKGAASKFNSSIDLETSEFIDGFGYNFATASVSGPIWKRNIAGTNGATREETVLGFRLSGQFVTRADPSPSYLGSYRATDAFRNSILENPFNADGTLRLSDITADDVERIKARENARDTDYTINGKLDFVPTSGMTLTVGGQYFSSDAKQAFDSYRLMNADRNPSYLESDWRVYGRFRHTIGGNLLDLSDEEREARTSALIQNINYSLQFDFTQNTNLYQDNIHQDDLFSYGHVAKLVRDIQNDYEFEESYIAPDGVEYQNVEVDQGIIDPIVEYNPVANNQQIANYYIPSEIIGVSGEPFPIDQINGRQINALFGQYDYSVAGRPFDFYDTEKDNQIGVTASAGFDILGRGGDSPSKHSIQFGIYYEQRQDRNYELRPAALWDFAIQRINDGIDPLTTYTYADDRITFDYSNVTGTFGRRFREAYGIPYNESINIENYSSSDLSLDMFDSKNLIEDFGRLRLSYFGHDYTGNEVGGDVTFEDFFTATDAEGELTRPIAPLQPIYAAAYLQDKFSFKDMYFNLGVRVDRYDANRTVPSDPYSLFSTQSASEVGGTHPSSIGGEFVVYGDQESGSVTAYRDGEQWYDGDGNSVNDPIIIFGQSRPVPYLDDPNVVSTQANNFSPTNFEDYEPQITVMPRISFSFPLNENAGFFAHYDVLSRRPTENDATAIDYYNFEQSLNSGSTINNPNLRPSRTIDYQVGFQQKVSNTSAIKISAYYREQRDEVNQRQYFYSFPVGVYSSYDNRDFGTVKGFSLGYDLRETNNLSMKVNYTLQFAEGTGSNANQNRGATNRGNIRPFYPYDFDQRHNIVISLDYRYKGGKAYNGPVLFGKNILANTGLNLLSSVGSGRPFTPRSSPGFPANTAALDGNARGGQDIDGDFNGARLPWTSRIDLRVDRDIRIGKPDKPMYINIYARSQNLLNTENIVAVYSYTQSPTDDGYYSINTPLDDVTEYLYGLRLEKRDHYGLPRRIRVGVSLSF